MKQETDNGNLKDNNNKAHINEDEIDKLKEEIDSLKKQVKSYKRDDNTEKLSDKISLNRHHWVQVIDFIKNSGLTYMAFIIISILLSLVGIQINKISILCIILMISYFYPLLTNNRQFIFETKVERWIKNLTINQSTYEKIVPDISKIKEFRNVNLNGNLNDSHDKENVSGRVNTNFITFSIYSIIGIILGAVSLFSFFNLPFVTIDVPLIGTKSTTLSDLLQSVNNVSTGLNSGNTSIQLIYYLFIILPVLYMIFSLISKGVTRILALLTAGIHCTVIVLIVLRVSSQTNSVLGSFASNIDYDNLVNYFGVGFWGTVIAPFVMFVFSLIAINKTN